MQSFTDWATTVTGVLEARFGSTYLTSEVFEDSATWTQIVHTAKAWLAPDGVTVYVRYDTDIQQTYLLAGSASLDGAAIAGTLAGLV
jgi:hypothetical protein